jgi:hypothetical protein
LAVLGFIVRAATYDGGLFGAAKKSANRGRGRIGRALGAPFSTTIIRPRMETF